VIPIPVAITIALPVIHVTPSRHPVTGKRLRKGNFTEQLFALNGNPVLYYPKKVLSAGILIKKTTMKKIILLLGVCISGFAANQASAQIKLGVNINIGSQPVWGPVGYDYVDNYYLPDIDVYYNVPKRQYIYLDRGQWIFAYSLPIRYRNYDLNRGYKVVINEDRPYRNAAVYRAKYSGYKGNHSQEIIRNSHEEKYYENRNHPEHNKWKGKSNNGKGKRGKH